MEIEADRGFRQARDEARQIAQEMAPDDVESLLGIALNREPADVDEKPDVELPPLVPPLAGDDIASTGSSSPGKKKAKLPKVEVSVPILRKLLNADCGARPRNSASDVSPVKPPSRKSSKPTPSRPRKKTWVRIS